MERVRASGSVSNPQGRVLRSPGANGERQKHRANLPICKSNKGSISSFMFCDFPETWEVSNLWMLFKRYGMVTDIYMARRRLRRGSRFGFVRFRNVENEDTILKGLNNIQADDRRISVYKAFDRINQGDRRMRINNNISASPMTMKYHTGGTRDNRSYKEVILDGGKGEIVMERKTQSDTSKNEAKENTKMGRVVDVIIPDERKELMKQCLIGEVRKIEYLECLSTICNMEGLSCKTLIYLGGFQVLLIMESQLEAKILIGNLDHSIRNWIWKLKIWDKHYNLSGRLTWVSILGVPVHGWFKEVFTEIAERWGPVLGYENCSIEGAKSLVMGKVLIQAVGSSPINENLIIKIDGESYNVMIMEDLGEIVNVDMKGKIESETDDEEAFLDSSSNESNSDGGSDDEMSQDHHASQRVEVEESVNGYTSNKNLNMGGDQDENVQEVSDDGQTGSRNLNMGVAQDDKVQEVLSGSSSKKAVEMNQSGGKTGVLSSGILEDTYNCNKVGINIVVGPSCGSNVDFPSGPDEKQLAQPHGLVMNDTNGQPAPEEKNMSSKPHITLDAVSTDVPPQQMSATETNTADIEANTGSQHLGENLSSRSGRHRKEGTWQGKISFRMIKDMARKRYALNSKGASSGINNHSKHGKSDGRRTGSRRTGSQGKQGSREGVLTSSSCNSIPNLGTNSKFNEVGELLGFAADSTDANKKGESDGGYNIPSGC